MSEACDYCGSEQYRVLAPATKNRNRTVRRRVPERVRQQVHQDTLELVGREQRGHLGPDGRVQPHLPASRLRLEAPE